jgi:hypothetical protein
MINIFKGFSQTDSYSKNALSEKIYRSKENFKQEMIK